MEVGGGLEHLEQVFEHLIEQALAESAHITEDGDVGDVSAAEKL